MPHYLKVISPISPYPNPTPNPNPTPTPNPCPQACLRVRLEAAQLLRQKAPRERLIRSNTVFSQIDTDGELGLGVRGRGRAGTGLG